MSKYFRNQGIEDKGRSKNLSRQGDKDLLKPGKTRIYTPIQEPDSEALTEAKSKIKTLINDYNSIIRDTVLRPRRRTSPIDDFKEMGDKLVGIDSEFKNGKLDEEKFIEKLNELGDEFRLRYNKRIEQKGV
jgi:hypothetical protein